MLQTQLCHHAFTMAQTRSTEHTLVKLAHRTYSMPFPHCQTLALSITYTSYHRTIISLAAYIIKVAVYKNDGSCMAESCFHDVS